MAEHRIPSVIHENVRASFEPDFESTRNSIDSLSSLSHPGISNSLDLNDELASTGDQSSNLALSRRSFESSSFVTSSFRPSFDDSLPLLGLNRLSIQKLSPLGPNSIYEIIADVDSKKNTNNTLSPNPNKSKKNLHLKPPTQRDIPAVHLSKVEKAPKEELKQYLIDLGKEYEKYSSNKQLTATTLESFVKKQQGGDQNNNDLLEQEIDSLNTIPEIYFSENFNLDDPRVFKAVTEGNKLDKLNELAQDKLSWYLDTVEVHLVNEISKSSSSFFDALTDLNNISLKNQNTVQLINNLKGKLSKLQSQKITKLLDKLNLITKRTNIDKLEQGFLQISMVLNQSDIAESYFLKGEYEKCLDKVDYVESLIKGEVTDLNWPHKLVDLRTVPALINIRELLCNLRIQTGQSYSKVFISFLLDDLRKHYEEIDFVKVTERLVNNSSYKVEIKDEFKSKLNEYIIGLTRCEELASAFNNYEEQVVNEMKNIVRQFLPSEEAESSESRAGTSSVSGSTSNKPSGKSLSALIKGMTPRDFEDMVIKIYATISEGLRRLQVHQKILLDLALSNIKQKDQDQINLIMQLDIKNSINKSAEIVQIRMGKIISVRKDINASLRYDYFLRFFYINSVFLNDSENISGMNFKFLPDIINSQIKIFNTTFHHHNLKAISHSLEKEDWKPLIVSHELQEVANKIVDNVNLDADQHWKKELLHLRPDSNSNDPKNDNDGNNKQTSHKRSIVVGDKTFVASSSLLTLISKISDYFILKQNFHHYSSMYETYLIELFKYYNSKSMNSIKKTDGTLDRDKNLSIVGESLDCLQELIHYIRIDFDNLELDELYNTVINNFAASKSKIA
ncbi:Vacuolar protein sorting-associated protein [Wickerhamomyces ciferrii]|uniref:Vacuolar protein sorting-associated protein n=1 Tax=Wickerhamomyces ciferrii (strain ATCC 14091 / BCRC 22168 / CBS 111 / JCM 3599 / NBRC 0793 / NRRL Y-1031 F-60-10) TaxID=1206466 RepID=K0KEM2_WICCF|nr:Vacuolar protein sorting-associated protein [Wickerhamomyces ciferrii]CCH41366.1 Vacuolar protein sorting-associated protein [Wickerhamomyces ciferrii]